METNKKHLFKNLILIMAIAIIPVCIVSGCIAPRVSPTVYEIESQPWRCSHCGHLTRSEQDLTSTRCPRCKRKGKMAKISEKDLEGYLGQQ